MNAMDWAWGKEGQFRSDVVPQVGLDAEISQSGRLGVKLATVAKYFTHKQQMRILTSSNMINN
jgi:hypothetical protein